MAKPPRGSKTPGEMCSYDPKTGLYTDRWLWEEILGEDPPGPPIPPRTNPSSSHPMTRRSRPQVIPDDPLD